MKQKIHIKVLLLATLALLGATSVNASAGHDHAPHQNKGGPNGGRLITLVEPYLEFFVTPERFVQITFLDQDGKFVPAGEQIVSAVGGDRSAPVEIEFVENAGMLRSTKALPDMKNMPIILQINATPDAKRVREKFYLNMSACSSCSFKEYACICGH
jgi:hypothetical protein